MAEIGALCLRGLPFSSLAHRQFQRKTTGVFDIAATVYGCRRTGLRYTVQVSIEVLMSCSRSIFLRECQSVCYWDNIPIGGSRFLIQYHFSLCFPGSDGYISQFIYITNKPFIILQPWGPWGSFLLVLRLQSVYGSDNTKYYWYFAVVFCLTLLCIKSPTTTTTTTICDLRFWVYYTVCSNNIHSHFVTVFGT